MTAELERFETFVREHFGLCCDETSRARLTDAFAKRVQKLRVTPAEYLARLEGSAPKAELRALAEALTVGETFFFRHYNQFLALQEIVLPDMLEANAVSKQLRIASLACASGEEAYSLAILAAEEIPAADWNVSVLGADVNAAALRQAASRTYNERSLRETPPAFRRRYFEPRQGKMVLQAEAAKAVRFYEINLLADDPDFWQKDRFDIVFCRNALMYFGPEQAKAVVEKIVRSLAPGGYLFLGHAETLRGLSDALLQCHSHEAFYYRRPPASSSVRESRREAEARVRSSSRPWAAQTGSPLPPPEQHPPTLRNGLEELEGSAERMNELCARLDAITARRDSVAASSEPGTDVSEELLELLRQERFAEALDALEGQGSGPDALRPKAALLQAVLFVHHGRVSEAAAVCRRLLDSGGRFAGAHYLLALCFEAEGDLGKSAYHDRAALDLDPSFAMPRLHLGLLARRTLDDDLARSELTRALALLQREQPERLLLFGGGFTRDALRSLCQAELSACGGAK